MEHRTLTVSESEIAEALDVQAAEGFTLLKIVAHPFQHDQASPMFLLILVRQKT